MDISAAICYYRLAMKKHLETILKDDVQKVFDHFCACFNIRILFYSASGKELKVGLNHPDSDYCKLIQTCVYSKKTCLDMDEEKRQEALSKGKMICFRCHAGLRESIKPIFYEDSLLGYIAIGQFRSDDTIPDHVEAFIKNNRARDDVHAAYNRLPYVAQEKMDDILGLFSILVDYIVSQRMVVLKGISVFEEVNAFITSNLHKNISITDAANHVNKSTSTVSHLFKAKTGKSFKRYLIEAKLARAEEYMAANPEATIAEASASIGYFDPLYFSRIYTKYRGFPPSAFCAD